MYCNQATFLKTVKPWQIQQVIFRINFTFNKSSLFVNLQRVSDEFEFLHDLSGFLQLLDTAGGCYPETLLLHCLQIMVAALYGQQTSALGCDGAPEMGTALDMLRCIFQVPTILLFVIFR